MSVTKLMSRIVAPDQVIDGEDYMRKAINATDVMNQNNLASTLHDHTYGITSDPLTQFACVFSSLIHDVSQVNDFSFMFSEKSFYNSNLSSWDVSNAIIYWYWIRIRFLSFNVLIL